MIAQARHIAILTRWEWFKLRHRWLPWILLGIMVALAQLLFWLAATLSDEVSYRSTTENVVNGLGFSVVFATFIAMILAASVTGGEYGWGTLRPTLSLGAGRWQFLTSKVAVTLLTTAVILIIMSVTVAVSGFIAELLLAPPEAEPYESTSWLELLGIYGRMVYGCLPYILLAMFFAVLTGSNGVGIALSLGYYVAETFIISPILGVFEWGGDALAFLLSPNITAWQNLGESGGINTIGDVSAMAQGFVVITIYGLALGGAAFALFLRRDIAGAKGG